MAEQVVQVEAIQLISRTGSPSVVVNGGIVGQASSASKQPTTRPVVATPLTRTPSRVILNSQRTALRVLVSPLAGQRTPSQVNVAAGQRTSSTPSSQRTSQVTTPNSQSQRSITKILIKACPKGNKKESKTFSLRNIYPPNVGSVNTLKSLIIAQLPGEVSQW